LAKIPGGERVKPCLSCDALIPFEAKVCPLCSSRQAALPSTRPCPSCSTSLEPRALFCPKCGKLAVPTARIPVSKAPQAAKAPFLSRYLGLMINVLELASAAVLAFVLIDHFLN
jgi:RNA polymerase subunit RPABC4/transcription elongation factor Spt4